MENSKIYLQFKECLRNISAIGVALGRPILAPMVIVKFAFYTARALKQEGFSSNN